MLASELIRLIQECCQDAGGRDLEVMILDGFNGGGYKRTINIDPSLQEITPEEDDNCGDCEGRAGELVVHIGYGCY